PARSAASSARRAPTEPPCADDQRQHERDGARTVANAVVERDGERAETTISPSRTTGRSATPPHADNADLGIVDQRPHQQPSDPATRAEVPVAAPTLCDMGV